MWWQSVFCQTSYWFFFYRCHSHWMCCLKFWIRVWSLTIFFFFWLLYKFVTVGHCQNVWQDTVYGWFFSVYVFRMLKSYFDTTSSFDKEFTHRQEGEKKMKCKRFALCIYIHITLVTSHSKCFHSMIRNRPSFVCCERNIVSVESNRGVSSVTNEQKPTYCGTKDHEKNKNERKKKRID